MVQGGFNRGFRSSSHNKTEAYFEPGDNLGGKRTGFREETFLPMAGGDSTSKNLVGAVIKDAGETAAEESSLRHKRTKYYHMQGSPVTSTTFSQDHYLHPLEEPSPLGLTLKKTPSFIELLQMSLFQRDTMVPFVANNSSLEVGRKEDSKYAARQANAEKQKASNFPALLLRIGSWERTSRYEGDLVAKCYFAKRKLVWEVLDSGLKSKIEIQWSDITSLQASFPNNEPATLEVEVLRPPLFYREIDPQPRKHTVWQVTSDFTAGQASTHRRHLLQFAEGILDRHYEKLLQCDERLNLLSKEGIMDGDSPCFDFCGAVFQDQNVQSCYGTALEHKSHFFPHFDHSENSYLPPFSSPPCTRTPTVSSPFSSLPGTGTSRVSPQVKNLEPLELDGRVLDAAPQDTPSPSSVMDSRATEESGISDADDLHANVAAKCDQTRFAAPYSGFRSQGFDLLSMKSMDAYGNCAISRLSEKKLCNNSVLTGEGTCKANKNIFDDIAHSRATEESGISDADGLHVNVTAKCNQMMFSAPYGHFGNEGSDAAPQDTPSPCSAMNSWATEESGISDADDLHVKVTAKRNPMRFAAPYGGLGNQGSDLLAMKSMDTLVNRTVSDLSQKKFYHNSVPTGKGTWQFAAPYAGLGNQGSDMLAMKSMDTLVNRTVSDLSQNKFSHNAVPTGKGTWQANNMIFDNISHLWATEDSKINNAVGLQVNVTPQCDQMIFATPYSGLGNQGADFLSQKSMDTFVNRTVSRLSEKNFSHNSVPTDEEIWQTNNRILDDIAEQLLSDSFVSGASDEQNVIARIDSMYSLIEKDVSAANVLNGNIKSPENSGAAYGLGRLEKRVDDRQVCERNGNTKEKVLRTDDRINSQVNVMADGYLHCKGSTAIPRQDSLEDFLVNIPRIASFSGLFLDSSDEFVTSVEPTKTVGWNPFQ